MQCYCDGLVSKYGAYIASLHEYDIKVKGKQMRGKVCKDYLASKYLLSFIFVLVPLVLEVINIMI